MGKNWTVLTAVAKDMLDECSGLAARVPSRSPTGWWNIEGRPTDAVLEFYELKYGFPLIRLEMYELRQCTYSMIIGVPFSDNNTNVMSIIESVYIGPCIYQCDDAVNVQMVHGALTAVVREVESSGLLDKLKSKAAEECEKIISRAGVSAEEVMFYPEFGIGLTVSVEGNPTAIVMKHAKHNVSATFYYDGKTLIESADGKLRPDDHSITAAWRLMIDIATSKKANSAIEDL